MAAYTYIYTKGEDTINQQQCDVCGGLLIDELIITDHITATFVLLLCIHRWCTAVSVSTVRKEARNASNSPCIIDLFLFKCLHIYRTLLASHDKARGASR